MIFKETSWKETLNYKVIILIVLNSFNNFTFVSIKVRTITSVRKIPQLNNIKTINIFHKLLHYRSN